MNVVAHPNHQNYIIYQTNKLSLQISRETKLESLESSYFTVSGDTHGQFFDFIRIFRDDIGGGWPKRTNKYLFNGDMADRGTHINK